MIGISFIYGLLVGSYQIFPYSQINQFKDFLLNNDDQQSEIVQLSKPVEVIETGLERLLVKKIQLSYDVDVGRGGVMTTNGYNMFINVGGNNLNKGVIEVYDLNNRFKYQGDSLMAPLNYDQLMNSTLADMDGFDLFRYRVSGLHVEENSNSNYTLYATHNTYEEEENCISFNVSKTDISLEQKRLTQQNGWEKIFQASPCIYPEENVHFPTPFPGHMASGKIVEYDENTLLVSVGNFSDHPELYNSLPTDTTSSFGKFLLLDKTSGESEILAIGSRNSQGLLVDSEGTVWATEHGPYGGDELNIVESGENYGWPEVTYGVNYGNRKWPNSPDQGRHIGYKKPVHVWLPSIAPTNIIEIQGDKFPLWDGDFIVGSLRNRSLHRLRIKDNNQVLYDEEINMGERIRSLSVLPDGKLVVLNDWGSLLIIDEGGPIYEEIGPDEQNRITQLDRFDELLKNDSGRIEKSDKVTADDIFAQNCSSCHATSNTNGIGPHLNNLFGRQVGGLSDFNYSFSLEESEREWSPSLLKSFLNEPDEQFSDINMGEVPLTSSEIDSIVTYLE